MGRWVSWVVERKGWGKARKKEEEEDMETTEVGDSGRKLKKVEIVNIAHVAYCPFCPLPFFQAHSRDDRLLQTDHLRELPEGGLSPGI